jgi:hypothetical protein
MHSHISKYTPHTYQELLVLLIQDFHHPYLFFKDKLYILAGAHCCRWLIPIPLFHTWLRSWDVFFHMKHTLLSYCQAMAGIVNDASNFLYNITVVIVFFPWCNLFISEVQVLWKFFILLKSYHLSYIGAYYCLLKNSNLFVAQSEPINQYTNSYLNISSISTISFSIRSAFLVGIIVHQATYS